MAETTEKPENSNKVICRSRNAVNFIFENFYNSLKDCLQNDSTRTPEERSRYIKQFKEVYERMSQQNIIVNGETGYTECANTTPEYEPVDKQKEEHISEELLPRLDDSVVKVAKLRKRLPHVCVNAVTDFSNHQAAYMSKVKPKAHQVDMNKLISDTGDVTYFIDGQLLQQPCVDLSLLTKLASKDHQRAGHLQKALEMESADKNCQTAKVVYGQHPLVENGCPVFDVCPRKRGLDSGAFDDAPSCIKLHRHQTGY